jgi:hypothetical protein
MERISGPAECSGRIHSLTAEIAGVVRSLSSWGQPFRSEQATGYRVDLGASDSKTSCRCQRAPRDLQGQGQNDLVPLAVGLRKQKRHWASLASISMGLHPLQSERARSTRYPRWLLLRPIFRSHQIAAPRERCLAPLISPSPVRRLPFGRRRPSPECPDQRSALGRSLANSINGAGGRYSAGMSSGCW